MQFFTKKLRGFTLIELLVVIAIVGILAAIVLVSLRGVRDKARDARIKADLTQVRNIAETIYYDVTPSNFSALCDDPDNLNSDNPQLLIVQGDILDQGGTIVCNAAGDEYCVSSKLNLQKEGAVNYFCIDAFTRAKEVAVNCTGLTKCP